jgi:hypothetical protein
VYICEERESCIAPAIVDMAAEMWDFHPTDLSTSEGSLDVTSSTTIYINGDLSDIRRGAMQSVSKDGPIQIPELQATRQTIFAAGARACSLLSRSVAALTCILDFKNRYGFVGLHASLVPARRI